MKRLLLKCMVVSLIIGNTMNLLGQEIIKTNAFWLSTDVGLEWNKKLDFELSQSSRFEDIIGSFASTNTTFEIGYKITGWLEIQPGYRYTYRERKQRKFNRYQIALQARKKFGDWKLTWRSRLEQKNAIERDNKETRLRNKFTVALPIKELKIEPKIFMEYWYSYDPEIKDFSKYRIGIAVEVEIYKRGSLKVGYSYNNDLNQTELERENILVLGFAHKFKR